MLRTEVDGNPKIVQVRMHKSYLSNHRNEIVNLRKGQGVRTVEKYIRTIVRAIINRSMKNEGFLNWAGIELTVLDT